MSKNWLCPKSWFCSDDLNSPFGIHNQLKIATPFEIVPKFGVMVDVYLRYFFAKWTKFDMTDFIHPVQEFQKNRFSPIMN